MPSIHRFYLSPEEAAVAAPALVDREAHHALDVLRIKDGDHVIVQDGAGHQLHCTVRSHTKKRVELTVKEKRFTAAPPCPVTVLAAIPKGKIEIIIEKATELGAARIVPLLTERTVVHLDSTNARGKVDKWQQVAIEAIKQCGSPYLPKIEPPQTPAEFLARKEKFELPFVASLQAGSRNPQQVFKSFHTERTRLPKSACAWIGPEGDFTPAEYAAIEASGAIPITLGPLILRADTAVIAVLAVINHELRQ